MKKEVRLFIAGVHLRQMTFESGAVLHTGQNFYAFGTSLTGTAWYIDLKTNRDAESAFAECYSTIVTNCTVRKGSPAAPFTAGSSSSDDTQMMCDLGCTTTNCTNFDNTVFEIKNAYTVRDNVIRVEFTHPVRNFNGELNQKKDSTSSYTSTVKGLTNIKYKNNAGNNVAFSGVYLDEECTIELTGDLTQSEGNGTNKVYYCKR